MLPGIVASGSGSGAGTSAQALLHFEGPNNSTTFTDESGKTWTPTGGAKISTARARAGLASGLFDGVSSYIECDGGSDFAFGTGDFCINMSAYMANAATTFLLDNRFGSYGSDLVLYFDAGAGQLKAFIAGADRISVAMSTGAFVDMELSRTAGTTQLFIGGTSAGTYSDSSNYTGTKFILGARFNGANFWDGNIDEFRIIKGGGGHTSNYTPAFPLT